MTQFEPHYDTSRITPGAEWVLGHEEGCKVMQAARWRVQELNRGDELSDMSRVSCTCGHEDLRALAWPAPAGEGVALEFNDGCLWKMGTTDCLAMGCQSKVDPADDPIREAWENMREHQLWLYQQHSTEPERPPEGLYLYHEGEMHRVEEVAWYRRGNAVRCHAPAASNTWGDGPTLVDALRDMMSSATSTFQAIRFEADNKAPVWLDQALLEGSP